MNLNIYLNNFIDKIEVIIKNQFKTFITKAPTCKEAIISADFIFFPASSNFSLLSTSLSNNSITLFTPPLSHICTQTSSLTDKFPMVDSNSA